MTPKFYTFDEVLPLVDATARPYAESVADTYVVGIEYKGELFPLNTYGTAQEADSVVAELDKALSASLSPEITDETFDEEEASLLEGFTFVPNKRMAQIFIGKSNRLYFKSEITTPLDISPGRRVLIAYRPRDKAFAIVKPAAKSVTDDMRSAGYFVSKRKDVTCAKLFREFDLDQN